MPSETGIYWLTGKIAYIFANTLNILAFWLKFSWLTWSSIVNDPISNISLCTSHLNYDYEILPIFTWIALQNPLYYCKKLTEKPEGISVNLCPFNSNWISYVCRFSATLSSPNQWPIWWNCESYISNTPFWICLIPNLFPNNPDVHVGANWSRWSKTLDWLKEQGGKWRSQDFISEVEHFSGWSLRGGGYGWRSLPGARKISKICQIFLRKVQKMHYFNLFYTKFYKQWVNVLRV